MTGVKNIFDVVGRSMGAQMVRLNTIASNIANMESKAASAEEAYKPIRPVFKTVFGENYEPFKEALTEAFKTKSYILLVSGFFVCGFHITLVGTHVPKYVIDRGLEDWTAAAILSLIGLFNIFGSLLSGYMSAKMSKKIILSGIYFLRGISIILFIFTPASNLSAFLFGASFGFLWLSTVPATSGIVAHMFGTKYLGLLYGIVFLSHQIGSFFGAYLGGLFHDLYGSYDYAWYLAIALSVFAAIIHLPIKEEPVLRLKTE